MAFVLRSARKPLLYYDYRNRASDCDLALWEPCDQRGRFIAEATEGPFCHISTIVRFEDRLWNIAYEEGRNGFISPLSGDVRRFSGKISVFRLSTLSQVERDGVRRRLFSTIGGDYQWRSIRLLALAHFALFRFAERIPAVREWYDGLVKRQCAKHSSGICSSYVARSFRLGAGIHFGSKPEALVSPNDIVRCASPALDYLGTLTWPREWKL